jgi:hypothetical protein
MTRTSHLKGSESCKVSPAESFLESPAAADLALAAVWLWWRYVRSRWVVDATGSGEFTSTVVVPASSTPWKVLLVLLGATGSNGGNVGITNGGYGVLTFEALLPLLVREALEAAAPRSSTLLLQ